MRFLDEIRDNSGYYYIDDKLNLNDFVLMIAYAMPDINTNTTNIRNSSICG